MVLFAYACPYRLQPIRPVHLLDAALVFEFPIWCLFKIRLFCQSRIDSMNLCLNTPQ